MKADIPSQSKLSILNTLSLNQAFTLAKKKIREGAAEEAKKIYKDILKKFPRNKKAHKALFTLNKPPDQVVNNLLQLYRRGRLVEVTQQSNVILQQYPNASVVWDVLGLAAIQNRDLDLSILAFAKVVELKPNFAEAHNNLGTALKEQGKLDEAIEAYTKALSIKPDYAVAYNNKGNALKDQGKLDEAIQAYKKALAIRPDYAEAVENFQSLAVQLLPISAKYECDFETIEAQLNSEIVLRPMYQIQNVIKRYLQADFSKVRSYNNNFKACDQKLLARLSPKDKDFCNAYSIFIGKLLDSNWDEVPTFENKVYHLGESHCLSYAHRNIRIGDSSFRIAPRLTIGAKAFHFSRKKQDAFKSITKAHLLSLPKNSKVFLSYGEIDCRPNEGFISAARKLNKPLEELIDQTVEGYVKWFLEQNEDQKHHLFFINVPAPVYNTEYSADLNSKVARTVAHFNLALKKCSVKHGFDTVDVLRITAGNEGFSNSLFNIDNFHLGAKALPEIERQLC